MRMNDTFNIITGEVKHPRMIKSSNTRFASLDVIRRMKEGQSAGFKKDVPLPHGRTLGKPRDHELFQYSYIPKDITFGRTQPLTLETQTGRFGRKRQSETASLINASKTNFNILSHGVDSLGQVNWKDTRKRCPVSKFTEQGRTNAPNYRQDYKIEGKFNRKMAICNKGCQLQRSYGTDKMFRKFK